MIEIPMKALPVDFMRAGLPPLDASYEFNLLPCVILKSAKLNGKKVDDCICLLDEPPLSYPTWSYNKRFREKKLDISSSVLQVRENKRDTLSSALQDRKLEKLQEKLESLSTTATVDIEMLNTPLSNTSENIVLKCYLLRSIAIVKKKGDKEIKIAFNDVYSYIGIPEISDENSQEALRVKRKDVRDKVCKCLNFWKECKFIRNYNNTAKRITINL